MANSLSGAAESRERRPGEAVNRARAVPESPERLCWRNIRRSWQAYALLAPVFALLILFNYYPPVIGLVRAFYNWAPTRPHEAAAFVGLENFRAYLSYPETPMELMNAGKLLVLSVLTRVAVPFVMAELILAVRHGGIKEGYRLATVLPMLVPGIVYTLLWKHIYDPNLGPINGLLHSIGLGALAADWLGDPRTALYAIVGVGFPWVAGIGTLIFLGALAQIPDSVFDSCLLDGCTGVRRAVLIDLPLVMNTSRMLTVLAVVGALTSFESILVLTQGGPGYATHVPGLTMYFRAFSSGQFGYAAGIGLLLFVATMALTLVVNRSLRPYEERTES